MLSSYLVYYTQLTTVFISNDTRLTLVLQTAFFLRLFRFCLIELIVQFYNLWPYCCLIVRNYNGETVGRVVFIWHPLKDVEELNI